MKHPSVVVICGLALAIAAPVGAQTQASRADLLRQQAEEAYRNGDNLRALSYLEQAYAADPQPGILANRGLILERLGDTRRALADFEAYLATNPTADKRAAVETAIRRLRPEVLIGSEPTGLSVTIDDQLVPAGATPLRVNLTAGAHLVRFQEPGGVARETAFVVEPGHDQALQLQATRGLESASGGLTGLGDDSARRADTWAFVALNTGVAAAIGGGVLTLLMQNRKDSRDEADSRSDWKDLDASAERYQTAAGVAFGVSTAALATGLYFWFSGD